MSRIITYCLKLEESLPDPCCVTLFDMTFLGLMGLIIMTIANSAMIPSFQSSLLDNELRRIPLAGEWADAEREYSGAAAYRDFVVLLPQYPARVGNRLVAFPMTQLLSNTLPQPAFIDFDDGGLSDLISGFEGFEAIAFRGDDVFMTIESHTLTGMMGYLVRGKIHTQDSGKISIWLDSNSKVELPPRANLGNMTDEAIILLPGDRLLTLYEANGANAVPNSTAYLFDIRESSISKVKEVPLEAIEYRITDCTPADSTGKFWCINYLYPGDRERLRPAADTVTQVRSSSPSHEAAWNSSNQVVERLIQLEFDGTRVKVAGIAPIYLKLDSVGLARNWEGITRFPGHGFFLVTDKFPGSIFAFIETQQ